MSQPESSSSAEKYPAVLNPLWIISLFLSTSEALAVLGATQLVGWEQGLLVIFSVLFPGLVSVAFFAVIWKRPYVLYAPKDFTEATNVANYVEAMNATAFHTTRETLLALETSMAGVVQKALKSAQQVEGRSDEPPASYDTAVSIVRRELQGRFVVVHFDAHDGVAPPPVLFDAPPKVTVQNFLDYVYFSALDIGMLLEPFRYGADWQLQDADSGQILLKRANSSGRDDRLASEAGIQNGKEFGFQLFSVDERPGRRMRRGVA